MADEGVNAEGRSAPNVERTVRRTVEQLGAGRVFATAMFLLFAVLIARFAWDLPLIRDAESALYDIRAANFATQSDQDDRITLVVYTEDTNRQTGQISPVDRTILAQALQQIDEMGAKAIAIDILLDSPQDDDPLLQSTLRNMQTPTYLAYADHETNAEAITHEQEQDLKAYHDAVKTDEVRSTSIRLETDADGVARRWPNQPEGLPPLLALAVTGKTDSDFRQYRGPIRFLLPTSSERPVFNKFSIELLADPETSSFFADQIKGRYVLIGGDFADFDQFDTPFTRLGDPVTGAIQMIGLEVHAHMLAQLLDGYRLEEIPKAILWVTAVLVVIAGALSSLVQGRASAIGLMLTVQVLFFVTLPFFLELANVNTLNLPSMGWGLGWLLAYTSVGAAARVIGSKQRQFAQNALGKYLPRSIATEIMQNPDKLALHGEKRDIFCVFTDLEGFTKLSHSIAPEMVAQLLNDYLDRLSAVVLKYGGTLDKFVGDAVVAFWGAPIAYPDDGERAVKAAWAMYMAGEEFRKAVPEGVPPIGRTRVGMHYGEAIVGNFGGEGRIQYTALGDAMNTAARLESANKSLETKVLVSREAVERTGMAEWFRPMGKVTLRGRSTPVDIFEPVPDMQAAERDVVASLVAAHEKGDERSVASLTARLSDKVYDASIRNLVQRLRKTEKGESYVLG